MWYVDRSPGQHTREMDVRGSLRAREARSFTRLWLNVDLDTKISCTHGVGIHGNGKYMSADGRFFTMGGTLHQRKTRISFYNEHRCPKHPFFYHGYNDCLLVSLLRVTHTLVVRLQGPCGSLAAGLYRASHRCCCFEAGVNARRWLVWPRA